MAPIKRWTEVLTNRLTDLHKSFVCPVRSVLPYKLNSKSVVPTVSVSFLIIRPRQWVFQRFFRNWRNGINEASTIPKKWSSRLLKNEFFWILDSFAWHKSSKQGCKIWTTTGNMTRNITIIVQILFEWDDLSFSIWNIQLVFFRLKFIVLQFLREWALWNSYNSVKNTIKYFNKIDLLNMWLR